MSEKPSLFEVTKVRCNMQRSVEINILAVQHLNKQQLDRMFEFPHNSIKVSWAQ